MFSLIKPLRLGFSRERGVVHFKSFALRNADVGRDPVSELHLDHVAQDELLGLDTQLLALPESQSVLGDHVGEGLHDLGGF